MADLIEIDGVEVDLDSPCEVVRALKKVEIKITIGGGVARTRFGEDEVQWSASNRRSPRGSVDRNSIAAVP